MGSRGGKASPASGSRQIQQEDMSVKLYVASQEETLLKIRKYRNLDYLLPLKNFVNNGTNSLSFNVEV